MLVRSSRIIGPLFALSKKILGIVALEESYKLTGVHLCIRCLSLMRLSLDLTIDFFMYFNEVRGGGA